MTTEYPLRWSRLDSMSRFITLSSTSKSLGMINVSRGTPAFDFRVMFLVVRTGNGGRHDFSGNRRTCNPVLFYQDCKTVAVHRLDEIVRSAQVQSHCFVVHDRNHNHRNLGQFGVRLELAEHRPAIAVGHDDVQRDDRGANPLGKPQAFVSTADSEYIETQLPQETRHEVTNRWVVVYHQNRVPVSFHLGDHAGNNS